MARSRFEIATFNLYNLNRPGHRIYSDLDGWSDEQYAAKRDWTAGVLQRVNADAYGFQELWHGQALSDVFEAAGLSADYDLLIPENHEGQRIACAGAVRKGLLVGEPEWIEDFPENFQLSANGDDPQTPRVEVTLNAFSRPVLHYRIQPRQGSKPISVYVAHLKSKGPTAVYREAWYNDDRDYYKSHSTAIGAAVSTVRRTAEALALRMLLTDAYKGNDDPAIVLGDLNDGNGSNTLDIITAQPKFLTSPLYKGGGDVALYSMGRLLSLRSFRDVYYTYIHQGLRESLDHVLVTQELYDMSKKREWAFKRGNVVNDHLDSDDHKADGTGDHGVVSVTFEYWPAAEGDGD